MVVRYKSLLANEISDQIAAQMLINTITASVLIKAGHSSLKTPIMLPVYILQNAAASGVGRLLTQIALDRGVRSIRLVRSNQSAERLRSALPGPPVFSTSDSNWKEPAMDTLPCTVRRTAATRQVSHNPRLLAAGHQFTAARQ